MDMEQIPDFNPDEAPKGYVAVLASDGEGCPQCALRMSDDSTACSRPGTRCISEERKDSHNVVFRLKQEPALTTVDCSFGSKMAARIIDEQVDRSRKDAEAAGGLPWPFNTPKSSSRVQDSDSYGINRAERIKNWEMAAERMQPTPEPARRVHTGLATVAAMDHRAWGWGA